MKNILMILLSGLLCSKAVPLRAQQVESSSTPKTLYYYYPASNVYFNPSTKEYWYYDTATTTWVRATGLPAIMHLRKTPQYELYYNGEDVWKANSEHRKKYKAAQDANMRNRTKGVRDTL